MRAKEIVSRKEGKGRQVRARTIAKEAENGDELAPSRWRCAGDRALPADQQAVGMRARQIVRRGLAS